MKAATYISPPRVIIHAISIHAAREGGDPMLCGTCAGKKISIHAAREGGDRSQQQDRIALPISIHAAREGGDTSPNQGFHNLQRFQSTPPVKAATAILKLIMVAYIISIHAAREGGDRCLSRALSKAFYFNPRRP